MKRAVAGALVLLGCGKVNPVDPDAAIDGMPGPDPALTEVVLVSNTVNRDLDVLFVIDDSPSMLDKQTNLKNAFASFVSTLSAGGLPSLHLGVVTTDVGTRGTDEPALATGVGSGPGACNGNGKNGNLVTSLEINGPFIVDANGQVNYNGTLAQAFNSIASVGANGCGFEQPLQAMHRALDNNPANAGFLRPTARLGVIFLADEDDCSFKTPSILANDTASVESLGPLQSFRCTRFGVTCDVGGTTPTDMNQAGTKSSCHSNESSTYLADIGRFKTFLSGLKADPREIAVGAIVGSPSPLSVELRTPPGGGTALPAVTHACTYTGATGTEVADPAVRLAELSNSMPQGLVANVCNANLATPMTQLATMLKPLVGDACLQSEIVQPAMCEAFDLVGDTFVPLPACDANKTPPCYELVPDATICPAGTQHLRVSILRGQTTAPAWTSVRCKV